jgi:hypothetical protein
MNMALGVLPDNLMKDPELGIGRRLLETLMGNSLPKGNDADDAETRKQAIKSLG